MAPKKKLKHKSKKLPHDALFKRIMENDLAAREFLDEYLPKEVKELLNFNRIKVEKESYIGCIKASNATDLMFYLIIVLCSIFNRS